MQIAPALGFIFTEGVRKTSWAYPWELSGEFHGCHVSIYMSTSSENKRTVEYTHFDISIPTKREYTMSICVEGIGTKLKKFFTRNDDISSGDADFDKAFLIESDAPEQTSIYLRKPQIREAIRSLFGDSFHTKIEKNTVMISFRDMAIDQVVYKQTLEKFVPLVKKLGDAETSF